MSDRPDREQLQQLLDGELDDAETQRLSRLIEQDGALQRMLDEMTGDASGSYQPPPSTEPNVVRLVEQLRHMKPGSLTQPTDHAAEATDPIEFVGATDDAAPLGRLGPYNIQRLIDEGGSGVLYEAHDTKLDRTVAIKMLRRDLAALASARARFDREARTSAALSHDHIVTVYDVGFEPGFPPYLVMEYIRGESLRDHLRHRGALPAQEAARIAREVALGLEAAHNHGLVHRDIKPSNIMLDEQTGRARITDFGLARQPRSGSDITREGSIAGTPAYMSPEQIATPDLVDHVSDIYSLGAVLYELLTGERPFRGVTRMVLLQALNDDPRPPRRLHDQIPRDLETITLKCLDKDPARRYAHASELAEDLQRWSEGLPVRARPIGRVARAWRWSRRNRAAAGLLVAVPMLLIVTTIASGLVSFVLREQKRVEVDGRRIAEIHAHRLSQQRKAADAARKTAEHHARVAAQQRDLAANALNKLVFEVQHELDDSRAGSVKLKKKLIDIAVDGLAHLDREGETTGMIDAAQTNALWQRGDTFLLMGRTAAAKQQYEQALQVAQQAADRRVGDVDALRDLEMAHDKLAEISLTQGNTAAARGHYVKSLKIAQQVYDRQPTDPGAAQELIMSYAAVGDACISLGDIDTAGQYAANATKVINRWLDREAADPSIQQHLAMACDAIGSLYLALGNDDEGQKLLKRSRKMLDDMDMGLADDEDVAGSYTQLGVIALSLDDRRGAERYFQQAVREAEQAVKDQPDSLGAQMMLCDTYTQVGDAHLIDLDEPHKAKAYYDKALEIAESVAADDPQNLQSQQMLSVAHGQLGDMYLATDDNDTALAHYDQALAIAQAVAEADPTNAESQQVLSTAWEQIVEACLALERFDRARDAAKQSIEIDAALVKTNPGDVNTQLDLAIAYEKMALVEEMAGAEPAAVQWFDRSSQIMERLSKDERLPAAEKFNILITRMKMLSNHGDYPGLIALAPQLRALDPTDPEVLYNLARCLALVSELAEKAQAETRRREAVTALRDAHDLGFRDAVFALRDPDLESLQQRPDFRRLLRRMRPSR